MHYSNPVQFCVIYQAIIFSRGPTAQAHPEAMFVIVILIKQAKAFYTQSFFTKN